jgi:hypothetical protein
VSYGNFTSHQARQQQVTGGAKFLVLGVEVLYLSENVNGKFIE